MNASLLLLVLGLALLAPQGQAAPAAPQVKFKTSLGDVTIELFPDKAPKTVENFLEYTRSGFFDGTVFHRIIPGFVVQGGGMTADMTQKSTRPPIPNEADNGLKNLRGTLSMARTSDPNSASSQFFISLADNASLDHTGKTSQGWGYAVFGKVVAGMDVVDAMAKVKTGNRGFHQNVPVEPVVLIKAEVVAPAT
jgi:peptidyl-prolyl cis-trans isomerase B (cyclophilin B)